MTYDIIQINFPHSSFKWANGLYAIIETKENSIDICKLNDDGTLKTHTDGKLMLSVTGKNNKGITKTSLKYHHGNN